LAGRGWGVMIASGVGMVLLGAALAAATRALLAPSVKPPPPVAPTLPRKDDAPVELDEDRAPRATTLKTPPRAGKLPDELQRAEILAAMERVKPKADRCADEFHQNGIATVKMTLVSSGRVMQVKAEGELAGTPLGTCIEQAAKTASFRSFKRPTVTLTYPFLLKEKE
jgi:hypothetical protein